MFDPKKHDARLRRSRHMFEHNSGQRGVADADVLMRYAAEEMMERLSVVQRTFDHCIAAFGRTATLAETLGAAPNIKTVRRLEEAHCAVAPSEAPNRAQIHTAKLNDLALPAASADLIIAPWSLHWSPDIPGTIAQIANALRPDGLFLAALPGPDTLRELRETLLEAEAEITGGAARRIDPFTAVRDAGSLLQRAGFALPVTDQETLTLRYDSLDALVRDLRSFGATARFAADAPPLSRAIWRRARDLYQQNHSDADGRVRASFQIIWLSGWKPHKSQQKPLKPGSATTRLADALGTAEKKL